MVYGVLTLVLMFECVMFVVIDVVLSLLILVFRLLWSVRDFCVGCVLNCVCLKCSSCGQGILGCLLWVVFVCCRFWVGCSRTMLDFVLFACDLGGVRLRLFFVLGWLFHLAVLVLFSLIRFLLCMVSRFCGDLYAV